MSTLDAEPDGCEMSGNPHDYVRRANQHAPKSQEEVAAAAQALINEGHSEHSVAAILKIDLNSLRRMLGPKPVRS